MLLRGDLLLFLADCFRHCVEGLTQRFLGRHGCSFVLPRHHALIRLNQSNKLVTVHSNLLLKKIVGCSWWVENCIFLLTVVIERLRIATYDSFTCQIELLVVTVVIIIALVLMQLIDWVYLDHFAFHTSSLTQFTTILQLDCYCGWWWWYLG